MKDQPYLLEILTQTAAWKQPKLRKELFTQPMYQALKAQLQQQALTAYATLLFCSIKYVVYNWTKLGLFTGSCISKYGQAKVQKGQQFATILRSPNAHKWAGWPIAFIAGNFTFYGKILINIPQEHCMTIEKAHLINEVHIWFCFDKSTTHFSIRKYRASQKPLSIQ